MRPFLLFGAAYISGLLVGFGAPDYGLSIDGMHILPIGSAIGVAAAMLVRPDRG